MFDIVLAATEAADKSRLFGLDQQTLVQIVSHLVNVGLLAFVLAKILYKPVREFMAKRSERIRSQIENAMEEESKASELKAFYEQKHRDIDREREEILDAARKDAAEKSRRMLAEAKEEADTVRARAQANIATEWERIQAEMKIAILEVSAAMAEKMVTSAVSISKDAHEKLFDETMAELEGTSWRN